MCSHCPNFFYWLFGYSKLEENGTKSTVYGRKKRKSVTQQCYVYVLFRTFQFSSIKFSPELAKQNFLVLTSKCNSAQMVSLLVVGCLPQQSSGLMRRACGGLVTGCETWDHPLLLLHHSGHKSREILRGWRQMERLRDHSSLASDKKWRILIKGIRLVSYDYVLYNYSMVGI